MRLIPQILCGAVLSAAIASPLVVAQEAAVSPASVPPPVEVPVVPAKAPDAEPAAAGSVPSAAPALPAGARAMTREDVEAWLDGYFPYALASGDIAGAVVVVVKDGEVLLQKGYGFSDLAARKPVDPEDTLFRPGSVSKLFTWTAVMQQVEAGAIDLDADVNQYLDFEIRKRDGKPLTMRQIMTHTGGFEEAMRGLIFSDEASLLPLGETLRHWTPDRIHVPGATPAYSNYATALAGYIVERVSGQDFNDYVEQRIFAPLGMDSSSFRQPLPEALAKRMAKGYARLSEGKEKPYEFINLAPAGSMASSGADMAKFMIAHLNNGEYRGARILSAETAGQMHRTGQASVGTLNKMMLGFYENSLNSHFAIAHGGDTQWFHSDLRLFPDDGVGIFVSMNSAGREGANLHVRTQLAANFVQRYLPGPFPKGEGIGEEEAKAQNATIAGTYQSSRRPQNNVMGILNLLGQAKVVPNEDGTISVSMWPAPSGVPKKWQPIGKWLWQDAATGERLAAEVVDGKVTRFSMEFVAPIMVFERLSAWRASAPLLLALSFAAVLLTTLAWPVAALVRRHYRLPYPFAGADAKAHRAARWGSLLAALGVGSGMGLVLWMMSSLENLTGMDGVVTAVRLFVGAALIAGAALVLWSAWQVLRGSRRWYAKLWSAVLALSGLYLLWIGFAYHLIGFGANF
jgi:CubicO group peptidase (beta-lactamase class C family)